MSNKIIISAEERTTNERIFLALGRQGLSPNPPGYEVRVNDAVEAVLHTLEEAKDFAVYYKDTVLDGDAIIVLS